MLKCNFIVLFKNSGTTLYTNPRYDPDAEQKMYAMAAAGLIEQKNNYYLFLFY